MNPLSKLLDIELPLIQAPMAGVQGSALAVEVSNAGGLGSLPCALLAEDAMGDELRRLGSGTTKPFNLNFFCHPPPAQNPERESRWRSRLAPYYQELGIDLESTQPVPVRAPVSLRTIALAAEVRPRVVSFHFGLPAPEILDQVRAWGGKILASATTVEEALWLEAKGVDAIIAQGAEAGGHRGIFLNDDLTTQVGTLALVPQIVKTVKVPVIGAGGIADRSGVRAVMALGAAGVQLGTAFLLCPEATTSPLHRMALRSDSARHTALTNVFTGRPARGIVNRLVRELGPISPEAPAFPLAANPLFPLRAKAESQGNSDFSPLWSGQNATGCRAVPAAVLVRELAA
jgi:nitronate monooxygenase